MAKRRSKPAPKRAVRLPSGKYAWRGRAVPFSRLPKAARSKLRTAWAKKAARTTKRRAADIVVAREPFGRTGLAFKVDRDPDSQTIRRVSREVLAAAREEMPDADRGAWVARIEWPDDDRSEPGEPFSTVVSRPARSFEREDFSPEAERAEMEAFLAEIEETGGPFLDRNKSGARGRARVVMVEFAVWYGM